jgi:hypothetical protein
MMEAPLVLPVYWYAVMPPASSASSTCLMALPRSDCMACRSPDSRLCTRVSSSGMGRNVIWSRYGIPSRQ